jgi:glutamine amidotransferase
MNIAVIDYGMGNLRSVQKALQTVAPGVSVRLARTPREVQEADRVVFPGQGAMPDCMGALQRQEMHEAVLRAARERPFLGICVGLQMLFERSEEGGAAGLGLFAGEVVRFPRDGAFAPGQAHLKVPHMGWNRVENAREHPVLPARARPHRLWHRLHFGGGARQPRGGAIPPREERAGRAGATRALRALGSMSAAQRRGCGSPHRVTTTAAETAQRDL